MGIKYTVHSSLEVEKTCDVCGNTIYGESQNMARTTMYSGKQFTVTVIPTVGPHVEHMCFDCMNAILKLTCGMG